MDGFTNEELNVIFEATKNLTQILKNLNVDKDKIKLMDSIQTKIINKQIGWD